MRYRIQNFSSSADSIVLYGFCQKRNPPYCPQDDVTYPYISAAHQRAMCDIVTENFKARSAKGEVIINPLVSEEFQMTLTLPYASAQINNNWDEGYFRQGNPLPFPYSAEAWLTSCESTVISDYLEQFEGERQIALAQAWANVDQSEVAMLASLGELPETLNWFKDLVGRLLKVLRVFSSRRALLQALKPGKSTKKHSADMLDFWMEFRYAVRPLLFEAEQWRNALAKCFDGKIRFTARGYHSTEESTTVDYDADPKSWITTSYYGSVKRISDYRAGVLYDFDTTLPGWISTFGLDQLIETGWELTRLSFALDWIFNIGDVLSAWSLPMACSPLGSWVTEYHEFLHSVECSVSTHDFADRNLSDVDTGDGEFYSVRKIKRRIVNPELSYFPRVRLNLSLAKLVDLVAIGRSICRSLFR